MAPRRTSAHSTHKGVITTLLCKLLGHLDGGDDVVASWIAAVGSRREPTTTMDPERQIDQAAACLYDERLALALDGFLIGLRLVDRVRESGEPLALPLDALARIGVGMVENKRRRFGPADFSLSEARARANDTGHPLLLRVADYLWASNRSDMGDASDDLLKMFDVPERIAPSTIPAVLVECTRARHLAKLHYRAGNRDGALEAVVDIEKNPLFGSLSALVRGLFLRDRGVIYTFCEDHAAARKHLRDAKELFERIEYEPGIVRATQSLARSHLFIDIQEAEDQLLRVRKILDARRRRGDGDMPAEVADLESRFGDVCFIRGDFERATEHYRRDRELTVRELGAPIRALAYIDFNLGRVLLARELHADAIAHLRRSADGFAKVDDPFNALRSRQMLTEALIEARQSAEAESQLRIVEELLERLPDPGDRPKQQSALEVLRARIDLMCHHDPTRAQAHLRQAQRLLQGFSKDAHFIRVMIASAEVLVHVADTRNARRLLSKSARLAEAAGLQDLQKRAERLMHAVQADGIEDEQRSEIEAACRRERDGMLELEVAVLVAHVRGLAGATSEFGDDMLRMLAQLLSEYSSAMVGCAELHDGQLVRFDGDSVLVLFERRKAAWPKEVLAVQAALQMHERFRSLRERWAHRRALPPGYSLEMAVGIASGRAIAGYFGIAPHRDFAAAGSAVAEASALEHHSEDGEIIVSRNAHAELQQWWPTLVMSPAQFANGGGHRVHFGYRIDSRNSYSRPEWLHPRDVVPAL